MIMDRVLTERRMMRIEEEPLKINEFMGPLLNSFRVTKEEF